MPPPILLIRAADWYSREDQVDEAIRHLLLAGRAAAAMELLKSSQDWFFERGAAADYLLLGEQAATATGVADPEVLLMMAYAAVLSGRFERVRHWCDVAEPLLEDGSVSISRLEECRCLPADHARGLRVRRRGGGCGLRRWARCRRARVRSWSARLRAGADCARQRTHARGGVRPTR